MTDTAELLCEIQDNTGIITLNRPAALNALSQTMVQEMFATLQSWENNPTIHTIILQATGEKAFCAGGDIRRLYNAALEKDDAVFDFFFEEYNLNYFLATCKKPVISLLNGITMGGGVGISQLGGQRVATEKYLFAMPETGIGFFPDVGGSYFLPRLPHHAGFYLALTGARIKADVAKELGLVDVIVASEEMDQVRQLISDNPEQNITTLLSKLSITPKPSELSANYPIIDECFQADTVEEIIARLQRIGSPFTLATIATLQQQSPTSLKVTLEQCRRGKTMSIGECLQMEYRMVQHFFLQPDFVEGIRAAIIDKDRQPKWFPNQLADIDSASVEAFFSKHPREIKLKS